MPSPQESVNSPDQYYLQRHQPVPVQIEEPAEPFDRATLHPLPNAEAGETGNSDEEASASGTPEEADTALSDLEAEKPGSTDSQGVPDMKHLLEYEDRHLVGEASIVNPPSERRSIQPGGRVGIDEILPYLKAGEGDNSGVVVPFTLPDDTESAPQVPVQRIRSRYEVID